LLSVLDRQLADKEYLVSEYSIADIATFPWVNALIEHYEASTALGLSNYGNVGAWLARCNARPAAAKGKLVNALPKHPN
jgi:GST-like protein